MLSLGLCRDDALFEMLVHAVLIGIDPGVASVGEGVTGIGDEVAVRVGADDAAAQDQADQIIAVEEILASAGRPT